MHLLPFALRPIVGFQTFVCTSTPADDTGMLGCLPEAAVSAGIIRPLPPFEASGGDDNPGHRPPFREGLTLNAPHLVARHHFEVLAVSCQPHLRYRLTKEGTSGFFVSEPSAASCQLSILNSRQSAVTGLGRAEQSRLAGRPLVARR
eukprot:351875-Chlamydomonas_euryale.AAC.2